MNMKGKGTLARRRPEWDNSMQGTRDSYKLSPEKLLERRLQRVSHHQLREQLDIVKTPHKQVSESNKVSPSNQCQRAQVKIEPERESVTKKQSVKRTATITTVLEAKNTAPSSSSNQQVELLASKIAHLCSQNEDARKTHLTMESTMQNVHEQIMQLQSAMARLESWQLSIENRLDRMESMLPSMSSATFDREEAEPLSADRVTIEIPSADTGVDDATLQSGTSVRTTNVNKVLMGRTFTASTIQSTSRSEDSDRLWVTEGAMSHFEHLFPDFASTQEGGTT